MSKQTQGETTFDPHDKDPHRRKVQISKPNKSFVRKPKPKRPRNQVTIGEFVYTRSKARAGSPLYGKWYKRRKGESLIESVIVDSPPDYYGPSGNHLGKNY